MGDKRCLPPSSPTRARSPGGARGQRLKAPWWCTAPPRQVMRKERGCTRHHAGDKPQRRRTAEYHTNNHPPAYYCLRRTRPHAKESVLLARFPFLFVRPLGCGGWVSARATLARGRPPAPAAGNECRWGGTITDRAVPPVVCTLGGRSGVPTRAAGGPAPEGFRPTPPLVVSEPRSRRCRPTTSE